MGQCCRYKNGLVLFQKNFTSNFQNVLRALKKIGRSFDLMEHLSANSRQNLSRRFFLKHWQSQKWRFVKFDNFGIKI
jgi:hypothetical protein